MGSQEYVFSSSLDSTYLKEAYADDCNYALDMFEIFTSIIDDELLEIKNTIQTKNQEDIGRALHRMKPTFTMVGLREVSDCIASLEDDVRKNKDVDYILWHSKFESLMDLKLPLVHLEIKNIKEWLKN